MGPPDYPAGTPDKVMAKYPLNAYPTPGAAWTAVATDANVCRHPYLNNHASQYVPLYAYEFADRKAPWYFPPVSFDHGAAHTIDIQFLFPDWHGGPLGILHRLTPEERVLVGPTGGCMDELHVHRQSEPEGRSAVATLHKRCRRPIYRRM